MVPQREPGREYSQRAGIFEKECKKWNFDPAQILKHEKMGAVLQRFNLNNLEDLFAAIGYGALNVSTVIARVREEFHLERTEEPHEPLPLRPFEDKSLKNGVWVKGADNIMVRFAHCCNPLPGDEIIGYITRGRGVSIHRTDCPNIKYYRQNEAPRLIEVGWGDNVDGIFQVEIEINAIERSAWP